jgi:hypothetical protein
MKKKSFSFLFLFIAVIISGIIVLNSCEKEEQVTDANYEIEASDEPLLSAETRNLVIDELAKVVAISVNEKDVRIMFHNELSKQFTMDYDILYRFVAVKEVNSRFGKIKYSELLHKLAEENNLSLVNMDNNLEKFKNLQISAPAYFGEWQAESFIPNVISLPVEYTENEGIQVKSYNSNGSSTLVKEEEVKQPFLLVRESERVDPTGMIRVDINSFVLPAGYRTLSAEQAYEIAEHGNSNLKSAKVGSVNSLIEVVPDAELLKPNFVDSVKLIEDYLAYNPGKAVTDFEKDQLKAACTSYPAKPTNVTATPFTPYSIEVRWEENAAGVDYEIWRKYYRIKFISSWPFYVSEEVWENIAYIDNTPNPKSSVYADRNLISGTNYIYQIAAVTPEGCRSALSYPVDAYASWRNNNVNEKVKKIWISTDCWNWCCGLFDGMIELVCVPVYYDKKNNSTSFPKKPLTRKTKDEQKGKWCDYNNILFQWDMSRHAYNYMLSFYEDEAGNDKGVTITVGGEFKVSDNAKVTGSISYTIDNKDEEMGYFEVYYYHPSTNEYGLQPRKGTAVVVVGQ